MRILVAPDKFKGSLGAMDAAQAIAAGLRETLPEAEIVLLPIADGGEGTADVICSAAGGEWRSCQVHDAYGEVVHVRYGMIANGATAVIETSQAIGLWRIPVARRELLRASSFGAGEMLLEAARSAARRIIVGLGGSATNDGGFGLARALGFRFLDRDARELTGAVPDLLRLARIEKPASLHLPVITVAADVTNPLLGDTGATRTFGKQKGGAPAELDQLENALGHLAEVVASDLGCDLRGSLGAGAAGGLGYALATFAAAEIHSGFGVVADCIGLEAAVRGADVIVTGEGSLDAQTLDGKGPCELARLARKCGKRIYAIAGQLEDAPELRALFDGIAVLVSPTVSSARAMAETPRLLRERAASLADLF